MEKRAQQILDKLERLLEWCPQDKDTSFYREIQVLVRYYEIKLMEEGSK